MNGAQQLIATIAHAIILAPISSNDRDALLAVCSAAHVKAGEIYGEGGAPVLEPAPNPPPEISGAASETPSASETTLGEVVYRDGTVETVHITE